ncbi:Na/Pi symporter [uncultured Ilyobacter sp.]|uniref:Na/Pi symporter n=1 Tax=uncultured Ilyobacter sp. TaxID=544433 RepID=UPI0029C0847D|nr:Na/Pi symporter [uncultured Ilyobacter sp.]
MGTFITAIIQSSSVTTVMVVGFINASLMTLRQAIGIILGANIGTTITGWILVFKITEYGLPMIGIGAFVFLFSKDPKRKKKSLDLHRFRTYFSGIDPYEKRNDSLKGYASIYRVFPHLFCRKL